MNKFLFSRLAVDGIRKNKKLYAPYIFSIAVMIMIYYILSYLISSPALGVMGGGQNMKIIMSLGRIVMIVFSVLFLAYTNAFLTKRRNKEFALYNILGMNKKNVLRVVGRESIIVGAISIVAGLTAGFLLSKLFEIALLKTCGYPTSTVLHFSMRDAMWTVAFYVVILFVLFLITSTRIITNKPIELLHSTNAGEKEPKANILLAIIGILIMGGAYYMAITIKNPVAALGNFFVAVLMVIVATYILFISGSVFLCKALKKNKNYYYNKKHYVAVSGMLYRMKRNGAGLASICILSTMILVMLSSAGSLYFGESDSLDYLYPSDIQITARDRSNDLVSGEYEKEIDRRVQEIIEGEDITSYQNFHDSTLLAILKDGVLNMSDVINYEAEGFMELTVLSLDEYNKYGDGKDIIELKDDEILYGEYSGNDKTKELTIGDTTFKVKGSVDKRIPVVTVDIVNIGVIVTPDYEGFLKKVEDIAGPNQFYYKYSINMDVGGASENATNIANKLVDALETENLAEVECRLEYRAIFLELYGGLFVLGIFLSIAFILACVLIMYYKQITEGYEDAHAYEIMTKVGMTKEEIRRGIDSQTLVTFFSPLAMSGLHLAFSFPMVSKMLMIFGVFNKVYLIKIYAIIFVGFAILYLFVYKKTVKAYVDIVA